MTAPKKDDKAAESTPPDATKVAKPDTAKVAEPEQQGDVDICVDCFDGVWPVGNHAASCEHGTWSRDQGDAADEAERDAGEKRAAAEAEQARQNARQGIPT